VTVSVVIPCFNRYELTVNCLAALKTDNLEIILVDNGSFDDTRQLSGTLTVRNSHNLGFAKGCNQGAEVATGELVVFLNNDTEVQDGWLAPLVNQFADDTVSAVGPTLVYPDGTVQSAGIDITRDPIVATNRTVSDGGNVWAVTGACLMVRKTVFDEVGGFDEGYWNGYEDVDLCLRIWESGGTVRHVPQSTVVHLESQSGPERWERVRENEHRLQERWGDTEWLR
jgi:GT2 family glycosyltransferase